MFLTLGGEGVAVADAAQAFLLRVPPIRVVRDTGAGDAFMAGAVYAYLRGASLLDMSVYGSIMSAMSLSSPQTVNPRLCAEKLEAEWLNTRDQYSKEEFE